MISQRPLSLIVQLIHLRLYHPEGVGSIRKHGREALIWKQQIRPDPLGANYLIELHYILWKNPKVLVRSPNLRQLAGERKLPHIFKDVDGMVHLCLSKEGNWRPDRLVSTTHIIWAAEWFRFFEQWLLTGEWLGGGVHPTAIVPPRRTFQSVEPL